MGRGGRDERKRKGRRHTVVSKTMPNAYCSVQNADPGIVSTHPTLLLLFLSTPNSLYLRPSSFATTISRSSVSVYQPSHNPDKPANEGRGLGKFANGAGSIHWRQISCHFWKNAAIVCFLKPMKHAWGTKGSSTFRHSFHTARKWGL